VTALIGSIVALLFGFGSRVLVGIAFAAEAGFGLWVRPRVDLAIATAARPGRELDMLVGILESVEERHFESERLQRAVRALRSDGALPSAVVRRLQRLLVLLDSRRNQFFAPLAVLLMWGTQMAMALEEWRGRHGDAISRWVVAVGELEALASLSAYHYERPEDTFPELVEQGPCFRAVALGHPLLQRQVCVRNDVRLDATHSLLIVSGSNMSGKSTLLRAVGVNAVLALAGAPVRAQHLALSCLHVGGTLRVQDSLRQGMSGFYAEIQRFRQLVDLASQAPPLLFLLEEILNTTNSHERRIGAEAVIGSLLRRRAIGLVTTHDLAITEVVPAVSGAANVHFVDHLEGDHIRFDYVLHSGVVGKGNAVDLMRSIGLEL